MFLPNSFIDALADYESARYVIFGVPFDNTSSFRAGSRWAPDAMRQVSANFESYNPTFDIDLVDLPIYDAGNLETSASVDETLQNLYEATKDLLNDGKLPIMLGGEHSLNILRSSLSYYKDVGLISFPHIIIIRMYLFKFV